MLFKESVNIHSIPLKTEDETFSIFPLILKLRKYPEKI